MNKEYLESIVKEWRKKFLFRNKNASDPDGTGRITMWEIRKNITIDEAELWLTSKAEEIYLKGREDNLLDMRDAISLMALQGRDDPDEQKGLLLFSRIMKYFNKILSQKKGTE